MEQWRRTGWDSQSSVNMSAHLLPNPAYDLTYRMSGQYRSEDRDLYARAIQAYACLIRPPAELSLIASTGLAFSNLERVCLQADVCGMRSVTVRVTE
jgi:hypothetical protein